MDLRFLIPLSAEEGKTGEGWPEEKQDQMDRRPQTANPASTGRV
jgi:hypothetical protein